MKLSDIDLNLFVVFDAIYTEGNLTRAGDIIGITQPAVSNSLSRLRNLFNDPLFVRTADGMVPTPVAQNIICLLYTSPSPRDRTRSRMPSSA